MTGIKSERRLMVTGWVSPQRSDCGQEKCFIFTSNGISFFFLFLFFLHSVSCPAKKIKTYAYA